MYLPSKNHPLGGAGLYICELFFLDVPTTKKLWLFWPFCFVLRYFADFCGRLVVICTRFAMFCANLRSFFGCADLRTFARKPGQ